MFAFLPKITPKKCGISSSTAEDADEQMKISASKDKQQISLLGPNQLKYVNGLPAVRRYDACYYEISTTPDDFKFETDENKEKMKIIINLTKLKNMNAYVYEGMNRYTATGSVNGNSQLRTDKKYAVPYTSGMLLVVYPNYNVETEFEFEYWVAPYDDTLGPAFYI